MAFREATSRRSKSDDVAAETVFEVLGLCDTRELTNDGGLVTDGDLEPAPTVGSLELLDTEHTVSSRVGGAGVRCSRMA